MDRRIRRLPAYFMNAKFRDHALSTNDSFNKKLIKSYISMLILLDNDDDDEADELLLLLLRKYRDLTWARVPRTIINRKHVTIDTFPCPGHYRATFGFLRRDLHKLKRYLQLPQEIILENNSVFSDEEMLLYCLYRYKSCDDQLKHVSVFGRDPSQLSRAFQWFNTFIINTWGQKLDNNLHYWKPFLPNFADAIRKKVMSLSDNTLHYERDEFTVFAFIDDNVNHTSRPGAGPDYHGDRDEDDIQRAFYNGWKKFHGIKWQSIELPNGMCMDLFGPVSFRRHDLELVEESDINDRLADLQEDEEVQYKLYGDRIFLFTSHILRAHPGDVHALTPQQSRENSIMSKTRIAVEWDFGCTSKLFKFTQFWNNVKLLKHENHRMYYFVSTFLRNLHVCCYGNITSNYFNCKPPSLESYLGVM